MYSRQSRHFLTLGAQCEQKVMWPQGREMVSLFWSEQTMHSSRHFSSGEAAEESAETMRPSGSSVDSSVLLEKKALNSMFMLAKEKSESYVWLFSF